MPYIKQIITTAHNNVERAIIILKKLPVIDFKKNVYMTKCNI